MWVWRHSRAQAAQGRCIGRTDLRVDRRRAKRLAHRIRHAARRQGLPRRVLSSPLRRCADVGRWLRRWGWQHEVVPALLEMDFGRLDGLAWSDIAQQEVGAWCEDFQTHRPGGAENVHDLFHRVAAWQPAQTPVCVVAHAGWMLARRWLATGRAWPGLSMAPTGLPLQPTAGVGACPDDGSRSGCCMHGERRTRCGTTAVRHAARNRGGRLPQDAISMGTEAWIDSHQAPIGVDPTTYGLTLIASGNPVVKLRRLSPSRHDLGLTRWHAGRDA
jgi:alpha-ribazole phosphatase